MGTESQTCGNCAHFDEEQEACLELVREGLGAQTTWKPTKVGLAGTIDKLQRTEWNRQPKPQDPCHFSDQSRWAPRQPGQGPDGL
jgi:hypothetical protein